MKRCFYITQSLVPLTEATKAAARPEPAQRAPAAAAIPHARLATTPQLRTIVPHPAPHDGDPTP